MSSTDYYAFNGSKAPGRARWRRPEKHRSFDDVTIVLARCAGENGLAAGEVHEHRIELRRWASDQPRLLNSTNTAIGQPQTTSDLEYGTDTLPVAGLADSGASASRGDGMRLFVNEDGRYRLSDDFRKVVDVSGLAQRFAGFGTGGVETDAPVAEEETLAFVEEPVAAYPVEEAPLGEGMWSREVDGRLYIFDLVVLALFVKPDAYHTVDEIARLQTEAYGTFTTNTEHGQAGHESYPQPEAMRQVLQSMVGVVAGVERHPEDEQRYQLNRFTFADHYSGTVMMKVYEWMRILGG